MMNNVENWITEWFVSNANYEKELQKKNRINYIENGLIDSFGFIQLIADIEEEFGFSFSDEDFEKEETFFIEGLIQVIEEKLK